MAKKIYDIPILKKLVRSVAKNPFLNHIAIGTNSGQVICFDLISNMIIFENKTQSQNFSALDFTVDGSIIAAGCTDLISIIWFPNGKDLVRYGKGELFFCMGQVKGIKFASNNNVIAQPIDDKIILRNHGQLEEVGFIDINTTEIIPFNDRLIALPYNKIAVVDLINQEVLAEKELLKDPWDWTSGHYLSFHKTKNLASLVVRRKNIYENLEEIELQVWSLFPLQLLYSHQLNNFALNSSYYLGGTYFADNSLFVFGKTEYLKYDF